jgi:hypothetical protein
MFDQLIAKTSTATATKAPAKARTMRKATVAKVAPATSTGIRFAVAQGVGRPVAGNALKAHTAAFLNASGMADGNPFAKATATKIIGARAVQYHLENGNFEHTDAGLIVSLKGAVAFTAFRSVDPELQKAYETFFKNGEMNPAINVKNSASIVKL